MTKNEFYMGKALEEAKTAFAGEILSARDYLSKESHCPCLQPAESLPCATAHAELLAIERPAASWAGGSCQAVRFTLPANPALCVPGHRQQPPGWVVYEYARPQGRRRPFACSAGRQSSPQSPGDRNRRRPGR